MMEAYHWLWDKEGVFDRYDFLVSTDACGSLYLKLGYDKGLAPDYQPPLDDEGYRISSTNVDHPAHQLALLAGLAELSQWFHRTSANAKSA